MADALTRQPGSLTEAEILSSWAFIPDRDFPGGNFFKVIAAATKDRDAHRAMKRLEKRVAKGEVFCRPVRWPLDGLAGLIAWNGRQDSPPPEVILRAYREACTVLLKMLDAPPGGRA